MARSLLAVEDVRPALPFIPENKLTANKVMRAVRRHLPYPGQPDDTTCIESGQLWMSMVGTCRGADSKKRKDSISSIALEALITVIHVLFAVMPFFIIQCYIIVISKFPSMQNMFGISLLVIFSMAACIPYAAVISYYRVDRNNRIHLTIREKVRDKLWTSSLRDTLRDMARHHVLPPILLSLHAALSGRDASRTAVAVLTTCGPVDAVQAMRLAESLAGTRVPRFLPRAVRITGEQSELVGRMLDGLNWPAPETGRRPSYLSGLIGMMTERMKEGAKGNR